MIWGRTYEERENWHEWFAWKPVRLVDGRKAWLTKVNRIGRRNYSGDRYWSYNR